MSNRNLHGDKSLQVEEKDHLPHYELTDTWEHFVSTKPLWMQKLPEGIKFCKDVPTPFEFCNKYERNDALLAISDGSVILHNMSYG